MSIKAVPLFIDTNGFLHLRDLKDLPWKEVFPDADRIDVLVSARVIEELDDFKTGSSGRKRNRARAALKLIDLASEKADFTLVVRELPVEVRLVVADLDRIDWNDLPKLDPSKPDDHIVADAISYGQGAIVFSHDTGPRISARRCGLTAKAPPEDWFLPSEQTDEEKRVRKLERDLARARANEPMIRAAFVDLDCPADQIEMVVPILSSLDSDLAKRIASAYLNDNPPYRIVATSDLYRFSAISGAYTHGDKADYDDKYERFRQSVEEYFGMLHERVRYISRAQSLSYLVQNDSSVTAEGLRIQVSIEGDAYLLAEDAERELGSVLLPKPPERPEPFSMLYVPTELPINNVPPIPEPRDPTAFYWFKRPEGGATSSALQCQDFRATELFEDDIWIQVNGELPFESVVHMRITATNLPEPKFMQTRITLAEEEVDWSDERVLARLPSFVSDALSSI